MQLARQVILSACFFGVVAGTAADARPLDSYKSIIDRNPFGLKDPPPATENKPAPPPGPPVKKDEFYLTGINTMGFPNRPKKAYLVNKDNSKKDYNEKYYALSIGDRQGDVALTEIDEKQRRVKIAYRGEDIWLSMKDNGVPTPAGPAPGAMPLQPPGMGMPGAPAVPQPGAAIPVPLPGASNPSQQPLYQGNANRRIPRSGNMGMGSSIPAPNGAYMPTVPGANPQQANAIDPAHMGPQTDAEMLEQILKMNQQNQQKVITPPPSANGSVPSQPIPVPPIPTFQ